ncbi:serine/threonine-protein kinase [Nocardia cyriacigeorgica]|uniref:serine/threonine-protein kinase n=1 Tax=Nocardia cyriacigeorgica TaxID=135487 RepID=UPI0018940AE9|nr:serine/threonine-protein kinase [Nocardia cyriacigeorgica]MBF6416622.1 serine/threonine protein kinase [Nocardia cyriacigeorgica]
MTLRPGSVVGGYVIETVLGAGGMGTVYAARHPSLPRVDAIKILGPELAADHEFRARFEREASLAAGLDHPNIVTIHNRGAENGLLWIAMQYVAGTDAAQVVERTPARMTPQRALRIITEVGKALDYAHQHGLLHRDVKPANFLLSGDDPATERVLLSDFGIAKSMGESTELTQAGSLLATIAYAAPEQLSGDPVGYRADIYSLGCSFYKMLTGKTPFAADSPARAIVGHLYEPPPRATATVPGLPEAIDQVIAVAMGKQPADRFATCAEFTAAAAEALHSGTAPNRAVPAYESGIGSSEPRRTVTTRLLIGTAVAVIAAAAAVGLWLSRSGDPAATASSTPSATQHQPPPTSIAQAREQNPAFAGKSITAVDVTDAEGLGTDAAVHLGTLPPADFLRALGFGYSTAFQANPGESAPRLLTADEQLGFRNSVTDILLVLRSDSRAGGGGYAGLPPMLWGRDAVMVIVDDPAVVTAFRNWTPDSERIMLERLVPLLTEQIR